MKLSRLAIKFPFYLWAILFICFVGLDYQSVLADEIIHYCKVKEIGNHVFKPGDKLQRSPDGQSVAVSTHKSLEVWDIETNTLRYTLKDESDEKVLDFAWKWDSSQLAITMPSHIRVFDIETGEDQSSWKPADSKQEVYFVDWRPNSDWLAIRTSDWVVIWDTATQQTVEEFSLKYSFSDRVVWSPDGKRLAFSDGYQVNVWNVEQAKIERQFGIGNNAEILVWNPESSQLAVELILEGIYIFDINSDERIAKIDGFDPVVWVSDENLLTGYGLDPDRHMVLWDTQTWKPTQQVQIDGRVFSYSLAFAPNTQEIVMFSDADKTIILAKKC